MRHWQRKKVAHLYNFVNAADNIIVLCCAVLIGRPDGTIKFIVMDRLCWALPCLTNVNTGSFCYHRDNRTLPAGLFRRRNSKHSYFTTKYKLGLRNCVTDIKLSGINKENTQLIYTRPKAKRKKTIKLKTTDSKSEVLNLEVILYAYLSFDHLKANQSSLLQS